ncbi:MAG: bifunctional phosphopantothenoylcysteine decarboxylase/phosphopantothenate--cysteine ligase CoaBC [Candidatus Goldiibacteriota bacterium]
MKKVVLGITAGIAAYRAADIAGGLSKQGFDVSCIMTEKAKEFITPLTLRVLSRNPVYDDLFYEAKMPGAPVKHIDLAQNCDLILIAPATANFIGKTANGIADDLLTTVVMASDKPVLIVPAMNTKMWQNPIVQENVKKLKSQGYYFIGPAGGRLACGGEGEGHIEDTEKIIKAVASRLKKNKKNKTVLITSGATREYIDDVRFISNPSTGKTGFYLAIEAEKRGYEVIFITGKTGKTPPAGKIIKTESAADMSDAVKKYYKKADIIIGAAAVGDFTAERKAGKISRLAKNGKKQDVRIKLAPTKDILAETGKNKGSRFIAGFSAESGADLEKTYEKIKRKNLDMIIFNDISKKNCGFEGDENSIKIINRNKKTVFSGKGEKSRLAEVIFDAIEKKGV